MQLDQELAGFQEDRDSLITIGVFDGVHLGHKFLIHKLKELARQQGLRSIVITFDKHPQEVLAPRSQPPFFTDSTEKANLLKKEGVDSVVILTFTKSLSRLGAREFLELLQKKLKMRGLVVGPDFVMGRDSEGDIATLKQLGTEMAFTLTVIPPATKDGEIVSSTTIRSALAEGNMQKVNLLMGRRFSLHGKVVRGTGRGASLGFPTANLEIPANQAIPADGVYLTLVYLAGNVYRSLTNVGSNPTFGNSKRTIESHLLDLNDVLYGHEIKIEFIRKLRDERKFASREELACQINLDVQHAKEMLKVEGITEHG